MLYSGSIDNNLPKNLLAKVDLAKSPFLCYNILSTTIYQKFLPSSTFFISLIVLCKIESKIPAT